MKKILALSFLTLAVLAGSAAADRDRGRGWKKHHRHRDHATWNGGVVVRTAPVRVAPRRVHVERTRVVRRPIFVQRPVISVRYYDYQRRPALITENYGPMAGYYWVRGQWTWSGYEWIWQPGHYEPDPSYIDASYYGDGGYYDGYQPSGGVSVSAGATWGY